MANASGFMGFQKSSPAAKKKSAPAKKVKGAAPKPAKGAKGAKSAKFGKAKQPSSRIAAAMTGSNYSAANC